MKKPIMYVDMDDTICKYKEHYDLMKKKNPNVEYPQSQYGFFLELGIVKDAARFFYFLEQYVDIWILTRPSVMNPLSYTEKRVWVEKNLGMKYAEKLIICPDKSLLKGAFLVDDVLWPEFEGLQIHFGSEHVPDWRSVYIHIKNALFGRN